MKWWWSKQVRKDVETARQQRKAAERLLEIEREQIIRPLQEMIQEDHISEILDGLVRVRTEKDAHGRRVKNDARPASS